MCNGEAICGIKNVIFYIEPGEPLCIFHQIAQAVYFCAIQNEASFILLHGDAPDI